MLSPFRCVFLGLIQTHLELLCVSFQVSDLSSLLFLLTSDYTTEVTDSNSYRIAEGSKWEERAEITGHADPVRVGAAMVGCAV